MFPSTPNPPDVTGRSLGLVFCTAKSLSSSSSPPSATAPFVVAATGRK